MGYQETINFSFVEERWERELAANTAPIKLQNPIASQMSVMRSSLIGSLVQVLQFNQARKAPRVRVFELGRVFLRNAAVQNTDTTVQGFDQPMRVAGLASGSVDALQWGRKDTGVDFFDVIELQRGHMCHRLQGTMATGALAIAESQAGRPIGRTQRARQHQFHPVHQGVQTLHQDIKFIVHENALVKTCRVQAVNFCSRR
jgi:hypothetical protein